MDVGIKTCVECESDYYATLSQMAELCPECAHILYGGDNCPHEFKDRRCVKCYWDMANIQII